MRRPFSWGLVPASCSQHGAPRWEKSVGITDESPNTDLEPPMILQRGVPGPCRERLRHPGTLQGRPGGKSLGLLAPPVSESAFPAPRRRLAPQGRVIMVPPEGAGPECQIQADMRLVVIESLNRIHRARRSTSPRLQPGSLLPPASPSPDRASGAPPSARALPTWSWSASEASPSPRHCGGFSPADLDAHNNSVRDGRAVGIADCEFAGRHPSSYAPPSTARFLTWYRIPGTGIRPPAFLGPH